jgi:hypothetical protein
VSSSSDGAVLQPLVLILTSGHVPPGDLHKYQRCGACPAMAAAAEGALLNIIQRYLNIVQ